MASSILTELPGASAAQTGVLPSRLVRSSAHEPLYEIVNGQRVELAPMSAYSTWIASCLLVHMWPFTATRSLGISATEMLFILDQARDLRRRPDVAFVSAQRWPADRPIPSEGDWEVVPDLAVEVVSPNDLAQHVLAKVHEYFMYGVRLVWVVYPDKRQVYVYNSPTEIRVLSDSEELDGGEVLPDLRIPLNTLFQ